MMQGMRFVGNNVRSLLPPRLNVALVSIQLPEQIGGKEQE